MFSQLATVLFLFSATSLAVLADKYYYLIESKLSFTNTRGLNFGYRMGSVTFFGGNKMPYLLTASSRPPFALHSGYIITMEDLSNYRSGPHIFMQINKLSGNFNGAQGPYEANGDLHEAICDGYSNVVELKIDPYSIGPKATAILTYKCRVAMGSDLRIATNGDKIGLKQWNAYFNNPLASGSGGDTWSVGIPGSLK